MSRPHRAASALRLLLHRARADLSSLLALAVLVAVTAALAAVVPRVLSETADQAVRDALSAAPEESLELSASTTNDAPPRQLTTIDRQIRDGFGPELDAVTTASGRGASTSLHDVRDRAMEPVRGKPFAWLQVRVQPDALDQVTWVAGRAPRPLGRATTVTGEGEEVPLLEVALSRAVAQQLDLRSGRTVVLEPLDVPPLGDGTTAVRITGLFDPVDPEAATWSSSTLVTEPGAEYSPDGQLVADYGAALAADGALRELSAASPILRYDWHYPVDASALDAVNAPGVLAGLQESVARGAFVPSAGPSVTGGADSVTLGSGLVALLETYVERAASARALVSLVLVGVLGVASTVLGLAAVVVVRRRADGVALLRARGASRSAVTLAALLEAALVVVPAAAVGAAVSGVAGGGRAAATSALLAALVAAVALLVVGLATWRAAAPAGGRSRVPWRAVVEVVVVVAAVLGVLEVRRRGLGGGGATGVDPVLVATPVLVVLALGVLVLRALPGLLAAASRRSAGLPGLLPFLGLARAARQPLAVAVPLATLMLGLGFAVFASGVTVTVDSGQQRSAWREVGADYLVEAEFLEERDVAAVADVPGVEAVVPALRRDQAKTFDPEGRIVRGSVLLVDSAAYADLLADTPGASDAEVAPELVRRLGEEVGEDAPLPVLATPEATGALGARVGEVDLTAGIGITEVDVRQEVASFPLDDAGPLVVLDLPAVQERESFPIRPNTLLVTAPASAADGLAEAVAGIEQPTTLTDRRAVLDELSGSPFVGSTQRLFTAGVAAAAAYCVLALSLALVLAARSRVRLTATLRMLGAPPTQTTRLAVLEVAPLLAVMVLAGAVAGVVLVLVLLPGVDLVPLTGGLAPPRPEVGLVRTGSVVVGLVLLVVATVPAVAAIERRRGLGKTLRGGDEQ